MPFKMSVKFNILLNCILNAFKVTGRQAGLDLLNYLKRIIGNLRFSSSFVKESV